MKIIANKPNYIVIDVKSRKEGLTFRVLFSYLTPVAIRNSNGDICVTDKFHSVTTSGHISKFIDGFQNPVVYPQHYFNTIEEQRV